MVLLQVPTLLNNLKSLGQELAPLTYPQIGGQDVIFPPKDANALVIFWASWCMPCKIEMGRLRSSVESGKIPKDKIFAINPFEERKVVEKFLKGNRYPFIFIEAPGISSLLKIDKTPTTLFLENKKITRMSSGMSFIGIWRAESLF